MDKGTIACLLLMAVMIAVTAVYMLLFAYAGDIVGAVSAGLTMSACCVYTGWCVAEYRRP